MPRSRCRPDARAGSRSRRAGSVSGCSCGLTGVCSWRASSTVASPLLGTDPPVTSKGWLLIVAPFSVTRVGSPMLIPGPAPARSRSPPGPSRARPAARSPSPRAPAAGCEAVGEAGVDDVARRPGEGAAAGARDDGFVVASPSRLRRSFWPAGLLPSPAEALARGLALVDCRAVRVDAAHVDVVRVAGPHRPLPRSAGSMISLRMSAGAGDVDQREPSSAGVVEEPEVQRDVDVEVELMTRPA